MREKYKRGLESWVESLEDRLEDLKESFCYLEEKIGRCLGEEDCDCGEEECNFTTELKHLINRYSMENGSDTPDFILANYLRNCLDAFDEALVARHDWYNKSEEQE